MSPARLNVESDHVDGPDFADEVEAEASVGGDEASALAEKAHVVPEEDAQNYRIK